MFTAGVQILGRKQIALGMSTLFFKRLFRTEVRVHQRACEGVPCSDAGIHAPSSARHAPAALSTLSPSGLVFF